MSLQPVMKFLEGERTRRGTGHFPIAGFGGFIGKVGDIGPAGDGVRVKPHEAAVPPSGAGSANQCFQIEPVLANEVDIPFGSDQSNRNPD